MTGWSRKIRIALAVTATAMVATVAPVAGDAPVAEVSAAAAYSNASDTYENRVVYWTNVKRKRHGLNPVRKRYCTDKYAESWSRHLAALAAFYHQDVTRLFDCNNVYTAGENLARGDMTPRQVVNAWMKSPGHRANILKARYTHIGVGSVYSRVDGRLYTAQTFTGR